MVLFFWFGLFDWIEDQRSRLTIRYGDELNHFTNQTDVNNWLEQHGLEADEELKQIIKELRHHR